VAQKVHFIYFTYLFNSNIRAKRPLTTYQ